MVMRGFHAYKSVAPLKLSYLILILLSSSGFHAYKSVAPLKHRRIEQPNPELKAFPRLQKRGPIEAVGGDV